MRRSSNSKQRIATAFAELCDAIGRALGAAEQWRDAAVQAHAETMTEMWLRAEGLDAAHADPGLRAVLANPRLAAPVDRVETDRDEAYAPWLGSAPGKLASILQGAAPGTAGDRPENWPEDPVGTVPATGTVPSLWYLGAGRIGGRPADGFGVGVPLLDESHLQISSTPDGRATAEALVQNLLLRVIRYFEPGRVRLHVWDVGSYTGTLPGLYPLTRSGLLTVHDPTRLPQLLEELSNRIRRVHTQVLVDGHPSLRALAAATGGDRREPWVVAVLIGNRSALREEDHRQLQRVARGGLACGIQLVLLDVPITVNAAVETVRVTDDGQATTSMTGPSVLVRPEPSRPVTELVAACAAISARFDEVRSQVRGLDDLLTGTQRSSITGLEAPVGWNVETGDEQTVRLDDASPHALIGGPSGSGKTNLLLSMICSLAARYSPDEVEFYLLDFKEGVSFAQFAPKPDSADEADKTDETDKNKAWLPHARLIGVNINTDREFGLALLQFLSEELRTRAARAKQEGVTKLEELRLKRPDERWPRIVAVIDEFQYLFAETDAVSKAATILLEDVARRGRSQGIHLVLASQNTSGIQAFWGRPAVFEQFVLRIALPRARRVLIDTNDAAVGLPRWHAVVNHESGTKHDNQIVRIPNASDPALINEVQRRLQPDEQAEQRSPRLFDGGITPSLGALLAERGPGEGPRAVVGRCISVGERTATVRLSATPGRNIGVLASVGTDATRVLGAAALSLVDQYPEPLGKLRVLLAPLVAEANPTAERIAERVAASGRRVEPVRLNTLQDTVVQLAATVERRLAGGYPGEPTLLVLFAADAADTVLNRQGTDALRRLLRSGPETGLHVLGWWRSIQRLRALLAGGASVDDLGAWVALDVHGAELGPLVPGMIVHWAPRAGRGLFFDRAQHAQPEVIIVPSLEVP